MRPKTPKEVARFYGLPTGKEYMACGWERTCPHRASHYYVGADLVVCPRHATANKHATMLLYDEEGLAEFERRERRRQDQMREDN